MIHSEGTHSWGRWPPDPVIAFSQRSGLFNIVRLELNMLTRILTAIAVIGSSIGRWPAIEVASAEPVALTWVCAYKVADAEQPVLSKYVVVGRTLSVVDPMERFLAFTKKPFMVLENNQHGLVAVSTASEPGKPKQAGHVGESSLIIDKSSGAAIWIEIFTDGPVSVERGTCTSVGAAGSGG